MMGVSRKDVQYVAELARLEFKPEEIDRFTHDLNSVLDYVNKLDELDTENIEALANPVHIENALREDELEGSLDREEVLMNAPDKLHGYFKVPRIIEG
jgi:aspartyl-tRNA(Asn)/glutamyl-tRNA(Gln) amidotransferase subunit C